MTDTKRIRKMTVHPVYARLLYVFLKQGSVDADAILARVGLNWGQLATDTEYLELDIFSQLLATANAALQRPWLGLDFGCGIHVPAHGAVGYAAVTSATLRDALQAVGRFGNLRMRDFVFQFMESSHTNALIVDNHEATGPVRIILYETLFASLMILMETAVGNIFDRVEVDMPFPEPPWREQYARFGIGRLGFGAERLIFRFPKELMDMACLTADVHLCERASRECVQALEQAAGAPLTARVRNILKKVIMEQGTTVVMPDVTEIAKRMHVSARTLMRKLKQEGSSYQAQVDLVRREQAVWYLCDSKESVEAIAFKLGYKDASNFSRTFRRWLGVTPKDFRDQGRK
jgi:AraC-like DNA-binding protein